MRKHLWAIGFSVVLAGFTTYAALDTFVIPRVGETGATAMDTSMILSPGNEAAPAEQEETQRITRDPDAEEGREHTSHATEPAGETVPGHGKKRKNREQGARESAAGNSTEQAMEDASGQSPAEAPARTGEAEQIGSYTDENAGITLSRYTVSETQVYVADVTLSSVAYLKTAFAGDSYGRNITGKTSEIAGAHQAVLAINGDFYGARETGYVIRNGVVYRDTPGEADVLCICGDGSFAIADPEEISADALRERGVWQALSFGPVLLEDGDVAVQEGDEVGRSMASNPRTAIGIIDDLHYVFVVSDGRTEESEGLSLRELARFMADLGVRTAYNLDGGGSSAMVFQGEVVNKPTTNGRIRERSVSDIVYIG